MAKLYGKGTITELVKGKKYRLALSAGKDARTGKYLRHQETFLGTRRQAQLRIEEIRRELQHGKAPNADKVNFGEWCEKYLAVREGMGKYRTATLKADRSRSKHLIRGLGTVGVSEITPAVIEEFYLSLRADGVGDTAILQCHKLLKRIMADAVKNSVITHNPCDLVSTPKKPKPKRRALGTAEAARLSEICAAGIPSANKTAVYLGLALGARLGEVLGLTWGHIVSDAPVPFAHIVQQHTAEGNETPLKTDDDDNPVGRVVPLDSAILDVLSAWKNMQRVELNGIGIEQGMDTPIVTNGLGGYTDHANFQRWWRSFCVENGFGRMVASDGKEIVTLEIGDDAALYPDAVILWKDSGGWPCDAEGKRYSRSYKRPTIKRRYDGLHFHELRHSHFTMRLADGMDIPTAQALGGWSTPTVLMNVYAHPVAENIWNSAGFMDRLTSKEKAAV